jgi:hypothetical protein
MCSTKRWSEWKPLQTLNEKSITMVTFHIASCATEEIYIHVLSQRPIIMICYKVVTGWQGSPAYSDLHIFFLRWESLQQAKYSLLISRWSLCCNLLNKKNKRGKSTLWISTGVRPSTPPRLLTAKFAYVYIVVPFIFLMTNVLNLRLALL